MPTSDLTNNKMLNGFLTAAIIGLLTWNVFTTHELGIAVGKVETTLQLQSGFTQQLFEQRTSRLEEWLTNISRRLADVEEHARDKDL